MNYKILKQHLCLDIIQREREFGNKIVFTNGCFDILHAGHVECLAQAKSFGDFLVVGLNSDASVRRLKGDNRPIQSENNRAIVLAGLSSVDAVVIFKQDTPQELIELIAPDVLVKGGEWSGQVIAGYDFVRSYGGQVKFVKMRDGLSTTKIEEKIRGFNSV